MIRAGCKAGHMSLTPLQHSRYSALELCLASREENEDLFKTSMLLLVSLVSKHEGSKASNPEINTIIERLRTEAEFKALRTAIESTKKFTPAAVAKLMKPFVRRMHNETYRELLARCQETRDYVRAHLFEGIVAGVAQREYIEARPRKESHSSQLSRDELRALTTDVDALAGLAPLPEQPAEADPDTPWRLHMEMVAANESPQLPTPPIPTSGISNTIG